MKKILWVTLIICFYNSMMAQRQYVNNTNTWFMYIGTHKMTPKWGLHLEGQLRRSDFLANQQQYLIRLGVNYHLNTQVMATAGFVYVQTEPYGKQPANSDFPENRFWEQIQVKNQIGKVEMVSRFRLEQRIVNAPMLIGSVYQPGYGIYTNRFRFMQRISIPFSGSTIGPKSFYATVFDELFVNFGKKVAFNIFDQNRLCVGIGYVVPKYGRFEVGYLNQRLFKGDGIKAEKNHTIQLAFLANMDFKKPKEETKFDKTKKGK
jgi:hypothetical protein